MRTFFLLLFLFGKTLIAVGQANSAEALLDSLQKFRLYGQHNKIIELGMNVVAKAKEEGKQDIAEKAFFQYMNTFKIIQNFEKVEELFHRKESILGSPISKKKQVEFYALLGDAKVRNTEYKEGIALLLKADSINKTEEYNLIQPKINLAQAYHEYGDLESCNNHFFEAYEFAKKQKNNKYAKAIILYNIVVINKDNLDKEPFYSYFLEFIQSKKKTPKKRHEFLLLTEKESMPEETLEKLYQKCKNENIITITKTDIAYLYLKKLRENKKQQKAIQIGEEELMFLKKKNILSDYIFMFQNKLSEIYQEIGQSNKAIQYLRNATHLKDSLLTQASKQYVDSLTIKYETAEKDLKILQQKTEIQQVNQQRNILVGTSLFLSILALGGYLFYRQRIKNTKRLAAKNAELHAQKIQDLEKTQKILALDAMNAGQENERRRIAKDLHDGLGGLLATIQLQFEAAQLENQQIGKTPAYQKATNLLNNASTEVRKIAHNMMPDALMELGLVQATEDLAEIVETTQNIQVQVHALEMNDRLTETQEVMLYRVIQELMNNILKYANAKNVIIQFSNFDNHLILEVEDDGKGFDIAQAKKAGGMGLKSIESRVQYLNGTIEMESEKKVGTTTTIRVPL